jgi:hypothetical protein
MSDIPWLPNWAEDPIEAALGFQLPDPFSGDGPRLAPNGSGDNGGDNGGANGVTRFPTDTRTSQGCPPVVVPVEVVERAKVPRGYVVVIDPQTKQKVGMLKAVARHCKLWKPARKPPISASDWRCLQKANSTVKKLDRVVKMSNRVTGKTNLTRTRRTSR